MTTTTTDIKYLKGVGEKRAESFKKLGIDTVGALLRFYPRMYENWGDVFLSYDAPMDQNVCIKAKIVTEITERVVRSNMTVYNFAIADSSGEVYVSLFNTKYLVNKLHVGSEYLFYGKLTGGHWSRQMSSPEIAEIGNARIKPIYSQIRGLPSTVIEKVMKNALSANIGQDPLSDEIREKYNLCSLRFALENIHFPTSYEALQKAKNRLVFEELFIFRTAFMLIKERNKKPSQKSVKRESLNEFLKALPFSLTSAQLRVTSECLDDMTSGKLMNRLIQGDVGSGKTAVAAALCFVAARSGYQAALMAPTEILAIQHYNTLSAILEPLSISCTLITGSTPKKQKSERLFTVASGETSVVIGTHALLSDNVEFKNLNLVITDEQHRFGVAQRARLAEKGQNVHTLVMSATPIPRTLGLVIYGDLDVSVIDEFPKGRQQIETFCVSGELRPRVYNYIKKHLDEGRQGYIVCPLVEESETADLNSAVKYCEDLKLGAFKNYNVDILHGKQSAKQKDAVMKDFKDGKIDLLVCTTVVEVGIDVPNAAIMVIENAERFGLSALHQLRGRIGRGEYKSTCILISDITDGPTKERLDVIKNNIDGFKIADEDLRLRGPGDFLGNRQHGLPKFNIADIYSDLDVLKLAGTAAENLLAEDRKLEKPEHKALKLEIAELYKKL